MLGVLCGKPQILFSLVLVFLQGCVNQNFDKVRLQDKQSSQILPNKLALADIRYWCMSGRSAASYGQSGWQAGVRWCLDDGKTTLELTGPINLNSVVIRYFQGELWVWESKDQLTISHSPELLLRSRLGFSVPLTALRYWLMGIAEPGMIASKQHDNFGHLSVLKQYDWVVRYSNYSLVDGHPLPGKIKLSKNKANLKIIVDHWRLGK